MTMSNDAASLCSRGHRSKDIETSNTSNSSQMPQCHATPIGFESLPSLNARSLRSENGALTLVHEHTGSPCIAHIGSSNKLFAMSRRNHNRANPVSDARIATTTKLNNWNIVPPPGLNSLRQSLARHCHICIK